MIGSSTHSCSIDQEISLYFHIPFCTRKCDYCHFYVLPDQERDKQKLAEGLQLEWNLLQPFLVQKNITTIYFGGGTPSLFGPERIKNILEFIQNDSVIQTNAEVTLEVNPENVTLELMQAYAKAGINRVSIGIQTLDRDLLTLLGRLHTPDRAIQAIQTTYQAGIQNISIDLMYDLPRQTLQHWGKTLDSVKELPITHLSLYNLTIEPQTIFFKNQTQLRPLIPNEEVSLEMYEMAMTHFEEIGLRRYEISAFAKEGYESKHNSGYWKARPFLGLGPSAFSYWEGKRFRNIAHLERYCRMLQAGQFPRDFEEKLDPEAHRRELFVINIRMREGVNLETFAQRHGALDQITLKTIKRLTAEGFLSLNNQHVQLTQKGVRFYDTIAVELI